MATANALRQTLQCSCGQTKIAVNSSDVLRLICYCKDCRGYYNTLNELAGIKHTKAEEAAAATPPHPALLDPWGGCDYTHIIDSADIKVVEGQDNVAVGKIRDKSAIKRFYAGCCSTPLCSVGPSGTFLINTNLIDEPNRVPVRYRIIGRNALASTDDKSRPSMSWSVPLSWFWTMSRRMPKDKTVPLPFAVPETIPVMENFKQG